MAPAAPEVEYDRVQDLPTSGFAAPVRGTNITGDDGPPPHVLESTDTMARLDDLLSSLSTGMDGWDGDGIFAPGGGVGRTGAGRRKPAGGSTHARGHGSGGMGMGSEEVPMPQQQPLRRKIRTPPQKH